MLFYISSALLAGLRDRHFPASAHALEVSLASLQQEEVRVVGKGAGSNAPILWQGVQVTTATPGGTFNFRTGDVPATCVGELSDGVETLFVAVNGCTASEIVVPEVNMALVPVTGQTASFADGDDGDIQAGVPFPDPRFTDNEDGTITDNLTGLIWLKNANCFGGRTWVNAPSDANNLAGGDCSLTDGSQVGDWRLPNVRELQSLVDYGESNPAFPAGHPFTNLQLNYWSSTTFAGNPSGAWRVSFSSGIVFNTAKTTLFFVLPVRGGL